MTAPVPLRTTRRGTLVGSLAVLAATGCDAVAPPPPADTGPGTTPSTTPPETSTDPDQALVAGVRADLAEASLLVTSALASRPGLRRELAPFDTLHTRHLRALDGERPVGRRPVRGNATAVRAATRAQETRLEASLTAAALAARSGPLAALLASMSAAVAQQLAETA